MKIAGFPQYEEAVRKALEETGCSNRQLPESVIEVGSGERKELAAPEW